MMLLTIDNLAHRYNCLPSEALARATTFDLHVLDISAKWSNHQHDIANGNVTKPKESDRAQIMRLYNQAKQYHEISRGEK